MASETKTLKVIIAGDASGAAKALKSLGLSADKAGEKVGGKGSGLSAKMGAMGGLAARAGLAAGAALGAAGIAAVGFGLKTASSLEQAKIGFTTMLGSGEKADAFIKQLQNFAAHTPFDFKGIQDSSQKLLAMGFHAQDVLPTMTAVGNAVAAVGGDAGTLDRVTVALGQMKAKGVASAEEMRQMTEAGIPIWDMLAKKIGKTVPEAMKMMQGRAIKSDTVIAAFREGSAKRYDGMMDKQSKTMAGMWSTIKDNATMALGNIMGAFLPLIEGAMPKLVSFTNKLQPAFQKVVDIAKLFIGSFTGKGADVELGSMTNKVIDLGSNARMMWDKFKKGWDETKPKLLEFWKVIQTQIVPAIKEIWKQAKPTLQQLWTTFQAVFKTIQVTVKIALAVLLFAWHNFGSTLLSFIVNTFGNLMQAIRGALKIIQGVLDIFIGIFTGNWGRAWKGVREVFSGAWDIIKAAFRQTVNVLLGFLGMIVHGAAAAFGWVPGVGGKLKKAAREFDTLRDNVNHALGGIRSPTVHVGIRVDNLATKLRQAGLNGQAAKNAQMIALSGRAVGGPVTGHTPYIVGEEGPEIFVPNGSGSIIPNDKLGGGRHSAIGGGGVAPIIVNVEIKGTVTSEKDLTKTLMRSIAEAQRRAGRPVTV